MAFIVPAPLIRRIVITRALKRRGAFSPETAVTLREAGVRNPNAFANITEWLVDAEVIARVEGERYYYVIPAKFTDPDY